MEYVSNLSTNPKVGTTLNSNTIREVVITSVLDEDPPCVGVGGLCKIPSV